jgi:hypothetical protein
MYLTSVALVREYLFGTGLIDIGNIVPYDLDNSDSKHVSTIEKILEHHQTIVHPRGGSKLRYTGPPETSALDSISGK